MARRCFKYQMRMIRIDLQSSPVERPSPPRRWQPKEFVLRPHTFPTMDQASLCLLPISLDQAELAASYAVHELIDPADGSDWSQRLEEIGFLPGERVSVMARGQPGNDPLAVRVGHSTFALRRAEAACIRVLPWTQGEAGR